MKATDCKNWVNNDLCPTLSQMMKGELTFDASIGPVMPETAGSLIVDGVVYSRAQYELIVDQIQIYLRTDSLAHLELSECSYSKIENGIIESTQHTAATFPGIGLTLTVSEITAKYKIENGVIIQTELISVPSAKTEHSLSYII
eukprot:391826_1